MPESIEQLSLAIVNGDGYARKHRACLWQWSRETDMPESIEHVFGNS